MVGKADSGKEAPGHDALATLERVTAEVARQQTVLAALQNQIASVVKAVQGASAPALQTEARPAEPKGTDGKAAPPKPKAKVSEAKPTEAKPAEARPAEVKPAEAKPAEAKPAEVEPAESAAAARAKTDGPPAEPKAPEARDKAKKAKAPAAEAPPAAPPPPPPAAGHATGPAASAMKPGGPPVGEPGAPLVNWVIGPPDNAGWAYGNNARRLAAQLPGYRHVMSGSEPAAVAVYFDVIVADRFPVPAKRSIVRLGGPRPLDRLFGEDPEKLREGLKRFDVVVALSLELFRRASRVHPNVRFIPNALDLQDFHPERAGIRKASEPFTVGFASSLKSALEIEVKGFNIAKEGAARAGVNFFFVEKKEGKQISHERMVEDFFAKCDVIAHPVLPGREGTSNVVMEAISLGIPVVTTVDCGFHGETLVDRKTAMIRPRDPDAYAEAFKTLKDDRKLRQRISQAARKFAERYHDIRTAGHIYAGIVDQLVGTASGAPRRPRVCFVPFWTPVEDFASSRLRAEQPCQYLREAGYGAASLGYEPEAEVALVIQSCDNDVWAKIAANPRQFLVYDVCDRYFENDKIFKRPAGDVSSLQRFQELMDRADLVTVPTRELKVEIASRYPHKAVVHVADGIDYAPRDNRVLVNPLTDKPVVLWFGNPDRGNFESSRWMIDILREKHGYTPLIVSRKSFFKKMPEYMPFVVDWSPEAMAEAFAKASLCVLSHASDEATKSPNRFISAIMHGVPTVVSNSPSCAEILAGAGMPFAIIDGPRQLERALLKLKDPSKRTPFVAKLQRRFRAAFGPQAIARAYTEVLVDRTFEKVVDRPLNVAFISHNLSVGEGAPWSLFELADGLNARSDIRSFVYSAGTGPLKAMYDAAKLPLEIFDPGINHCIKALTKRYADARQHFRDFLDRNAIDVVVCNTVRASPYGFMAEEAGRPVVLIIRESFAADSRFYPYEGETRVACEVGVASASKVVFVAETSRAAWADQRFLGDVRTIPNGVSPGRFAEVLTASKADIRASLDLPPNDVIAVCVGTVNQRKGQAGILKAFAGLPPAIRDKARVIFIGAVEGDYMAEFQGQIAALPEGVRERVQLVRTSPDVGPWYRAADLFLMNSTSEAYPRSVVEALLFGLPVLSTKVFGVLEQIQEGENGFLYDFDAMGVWAQGFGRLVGDDALRARMSTAAVRSFWKLTTHAEMLHAYRALIGDAHRRARLRAGTPGALAGEAQLLVTAAEQAPVRAAAALASVA